MNQGCQYEPLNSKTHPKNIASTPQDREVGKGFLNKTPFTK